MTYSNFKTLFETHCSILCGAFPSPNVNQILSVFTVFLSNEKHVWAHVPIDFFPGPFLILFFFLGLIFQNYFNKHHLQILTIIKIIQKLLLLNDF